MASMWEKLKAFDAHGRMNDDFRIKTVSGATCKTLSPCSLQVNGSSRTCAVSICGIILIGTMFISQLIWFMSIVRAPELN
jgi:hypothetical protein